MEPKTQTSDKITKRNFPKQGATLSDASGHEGVIYLQNNFLSIMATTGSVLSNNTHNKNSSGDEIANVNFYAVRPEATRIR